MLDQLLKIKRDHEDLQQKLAAPGVTANPKEYAGLARKEKELRPVIALINDYQKCVRSLEDSEKLLKTEKDPELLMLAKEELSDAKVTKERLENELKVVLIPRGPKDDKNVIIEIR